MIMLRNSLLAAASVIALMGTAPAGAAEQKTRPDSAGMQFGERTNQIKADELIGKDLKNLGGKTIGDIESVIIDKNGKVSAVIVGVGGFLGIGEREVAIDWSDMRVLRQNNVVQTTMTKTDLKALPEYKFHDEKFRKRAFYDEHYTARQAKKSDWMAAGRMRISKLIGADVVNAQGEEIGTVDDVIVDKDKTKLIVSVGEFLGLGGHEVELDLKEARYQQQRDDADDLRVHISMTKEQLKSLPKYKR